MPIVTIPVIVGVSCTRAPGTAVKVFVPIGALNNWAVIVAGAVRVTAAVVLKFAAKEVITPSRGTVNASLEVAGSNGSVLPTIVIAAGIEVPKPMNELAVIAVDRTVANKAGTVPDENGIIEPEAINLVFTLRIGVRVAQGLQ